MSQKGYKYIAKRMLKWVIKKTSITRKILIRKHSENLHISLFYNYVILLFINSISTCRFYRLRCSCLEDDGSRKRLYIYIYIYTTVKNIWPPSKFLFMILKVLFLTKQVNHQNVFFLFILLNTSLTLTLASPDIFWKIDLRAFFFKFR